MAPLGKRKPVTFGNLLISEGDGVVQLNLNSEHEGHPYALFTRGELPGLIKILQGLSKAPPAAAPVADDDDWRALI